MIRYVFALVLLALFLKTAVAQKAMAIYYVKNSGKIVSIKDSADFILAIMPPDTGIDKNLFIIKGFYPNGKLKMVAGSHTPDLPLKLQGPNIEFFLNGHKRMVRNFENGELTGDMTEYYPNGRFYNKKSYVKTLTEKTELQFRDCSDSTGKALAENGNGHWVVYNSDFTHIAESGKIVNGLRDSVWKIKYGLGVTQYKNGKITSDTGKIFTMVEIAPRFPEGDEAFGRFLARHIRYPHSALEHNTSGVVIISFVVEINGTLTGLKIIRGVGDGIDEEALRVIGLSPRWTPGMQNGKPVRVACSVPINFTLHR